MIQTAVWRGVFFSHPVKKFHDLCPQRRGTRETLWPEEGGKEHLYAEVLQEFLGLQLLVDMVLDELRENGFALLKRLPRELQSADLG